MKSLMRSVVACALVACGFAAEGFAGSNTKNVLYYSGSGNNSKSFAEAGTASKFITSNHSFTMAVWMKPGDSTTASQPLFFQGSIDGCDETYHSFGLFYNGTTKQIDFRRKTAWGWNDSLKTTADYPQDGKWHFIAGVYDAEAMTRTLYIDGSMVAQTTNVPKGDSFTKTTGISFGFQKWVNGYKGYLAEASVWGVAKTENEILAMRNARPTDFTDCYAYWPFDEGGALSSARDISGNGVTVTISNTTHANLCEVTDFDETFDPGDSRITYDVFIKYPQDRVSVEVSGTEMVGGRFVAGSEGTFTASGEGAFLGWAGDIPENQRMNLTVTITVDESKVIAPVFAYDWVYDSTAKTISDGYWTLNVTLKDSEITIAGVNTATFLNASDMPLMPLLDLRKRVADANGTTYDIVSFALGSFSGVSTLQEVRVPDTLRTISGTWYDNGAFVNCTALTNMTPFLPPSVNYIGICAFSGDTKLTGDLVLGDKEGTFTLPWANTSLAYFQNTAIKSVTAKENVRWIRAQMFNGCSKLESVTLEGNVTNIEANAFAGCSALKLFSLGHRPEAWPGYQGSTAYKCRFLVNAADPGWAAYMADSAKFTPWGSLDQTTKDKYTAAFPGVKKPIGLSKTLPANQWLCNLKEPGMKLIFR